MKHPYINGFHTENPTKPETVAPFVLVERTVRNMAFTGLVIPCGDRHAAEHLESRLFFDGPYKDVTYDIVTGDELKAISRYN